MRLTTRVLLGLLVGLALSIVLASWLPASWQPLAAWIEPIGTIWTRGLQLMVIPLVTTLLFTGVSSGGKGLGGLGVLDPPRDGADASIAKSRVPPSG